MSVTVSSMTSSASVKGRKNTPGAATPLSNDEVLAWLEHGVDSQASIEMVVDHGKAVEQILTGVPVIPKPAKVSARRFHEHAVILHGNSNLSRVHQHSPDIKYPIVLTPITSAFAHPNASAFEIARISKETRKYVSAHWGRFAQEIALPLRSAKVNIIRGCAVVLSLTGNPTALESLTAEDLTWLSANARKLAPHAQSLRTCTNFNTGYMRIALAELEMQRTVQDSPSAKRAISEKRSAKSR